MGDIDEIRIAYPFYPSPSCLLNARCRRNVYYVDRFLFACIHLLNTFYKQQIWMHVGMCKLIAMYTRTSMFWSDFPSPASTLSICLHAGCLTSNVNAKSSPPFLLLAKVFFHIYVFPIEFMHDFQTPLYYAHKYSLPLLLQSHNNLYKEEDNTYHSPCLLRTIRQKGGCYFTISFSFMNINWFTEIIKV